MIYLAGPYSSISPAIQEFRFQKLTEAAGVLMNKGLFVFSPVTHGHPISSMGGTPTSFEYWKSHNFHFLATCSILFLLELDGWEQSIGVQSELLEAERLGIPIKALDYETYEIKELSYG